MSAPAGILNPAHAIPVRQKTGPEEVESLQSSRAIAKTIIILAIPSNTANMSFRLSFLGRRQSTKSTLTTLQESVSAFEESLRENSSTLDDDSTSLNNSRRERLNLNKFSSMRSLDNGSDRRKRERRSFCGFDDSDYLGKSTLLNELKATSELTLEETHGNEINAKKIFVREARKSRMSTFEAPKFQDDLRKLLATQKYESKRSVASSTRSEWSETTESKKVSFVDVTIREYPIIVGDNPAGTGGPPLTIAWDHVSSVDLDIDKYEEVRAGNRRKQEEMKMKIDYRQKLLRGLGFTLTEMQKGAKAANIIRNRRRHVNAELYRDSTNESMEKAVRRMMTVVTLGFKKRREEKYLKKAYPNYSKEKELKKSRKRGSTASSSGSIAMSMDDSGSIAMMTV